MKKLAIALILVTMASTLSVVGVELVNADTSTLFIKFFGFVSLLLIDIYAIIAIIRDSKRD